MKIPTAALALAPVLVALMLPGPGVAQTSLNEIEALISRGRVAQARGALERWWNEERSTASPRARQHGLWLRGRLTLDGQEAELDFRRLVVEHPGSPYSDDALLRLGHGAHAEGDLKEAAGYFRTLVRDYPGSSLREEARSWLDRFGQEVAGVGSLPTEQPAPAVEHRSSGDEREDESRDSAPDAELPYAVQLGAFSSERRARRLWERVRSAELDPRLVRIPGSGLIRVRVGRFADSPGAEEVLHRVRSLGFEATIVTDVLEEEPLR